MTDQPMLCVYVGVLLQPRGMLAKALVCALSLGYVYGDTNGYGQ
jgi:hypothetical protein